MRSAGAALVVASLAVLSGASPARAAPRARAARVGPRAFDTIQQAIDAARPGDRVVLGRDVYRERITIAKPITLVGRRTVLDGVVAGLSGPCVTIASDDVTIEGVTFRNGGDQVVGDGDGLRVLRCAFVNAGQNAVDVTGDGVVVDRCSFVGATDVAVDVRGITCRVARSTFRNLGGGAVALRGDDAFVDRCTVRASAGGTVVDLAGDRVTVRRTSVVGGTGDLIAIDGEAALVDRCEAVGSSGGNGFDVLGDGADVVRCFASSVATGIRVRGDGAIVEGNDVRYVGSAGISVAGAAPEVRRNGVLFAHGNDAGIVVDDGGGPGGGTVEANAVEDCTVFGIRVEGRGVALVRNDVLRCGSPDTAGILVAGDDVSLDEDYAFDCAAHAFLVTGDRCTIAGAFAADAARDGFLLLGGSAQLTDAVARRCGGEGIENGGAGTVVQGSTFLGNRIDVAIRAGIPFGTFGTDNRYETGGPAVPAEIP